MTPPDSATRETREDARLAPIQVDVYDRRSVERGFPSRVPWEMSAQVWDVYAAAGHGAQSHTRICERGGWGVREFVTCILGRGFDVQAMRLVTAEDIATVRAMVEAALTSGVHGPRRER